jgi:ArsR family transcriptional regulator, arsenate/arsenite/antimonite-responsive transcriptional repressor / arsenate reductase (thioredoxin)
MMSAVLAPDILKLLAHDLRWQLVTALAGSDRRVQELVEQLARPQNLVSYHLRQLRDYQLVQERRSSADGRDIYYSLNLERLGVLYLESGQALHPALVNLTSPAASDTRPAMARPARVLFLCTHNSARSQLAEGILRARGGDQVVVHSAGSQPTAVHPLAVRAAAALGIDISGHRSKGVEPFIGQPFDAIITVCDRVREVCPVFPGDPQRIHWSFPDPAAVEGSEATQYHAFVQTARELATRINYLLLVIERQQ